jgi:cytochrome c-type biogenesis protein CcmE
LQLSPERDEIFRLGGLVQEKSLVRGSGTVVTFVVTDGNKAIPVEYSGILPDLFAEGQGMIATGKYVNKKFIASEILAKHDENYMPKEVVDTLKEQGYYKSKVN